MVVHCPLLTSFVKVNVFCGVHHVEYPLFFLSFSLALTVLTFLIKIPTDPDGQCCGCSVVFKLCILQV